MDKFQKEVLDSGILHRPLTIDKTNSYEQRQLAQEKIEKSVSLLTNRNDVWRHVGRGAIEVSADQVILSGDTRYSTHSWVLQKTVIM